MNETVTIEDHTVYPRFGGQMCHGCEWRSWEDGGTHAEHVAQLATTALVVRLQGLAAEWFKAEDEANAYGPRSAFDGRDCAEMLLDALRD